MKSLMMLWHSLAEELGEQCGVSTDLDLKQVKVRIEHQGLSFLTISLPEFCKDFEQSLALEEVVPNLFAGFKRRGRTPVFLGGFMDKVFDRGTGLLVDDPDIDSIHAVRQLTLLFSKMELPTSVKREADAMRGYVNCDEQVRRDDMVRTHAETLEFRQMSNRLWSGVLSRVDNTLYEEQGFNGVFNPHGPYLRPKHGPGATADRYRGNAKFDLTEWPQRLEEVFPYGDYLVPNERYLIDRYSRVDLLEPGAERPVRVVSVPKTMKSPRIIAIEPAAMQYMQQAVSSLLVKEIQQDSHIIAGSMVGFTDQDVNRRLACEGSLTGNLATLDLSEASDRVSWQLVQEMVSRHPLTRGALDATRSRQAEVQGHGIISLAKYASMGSALTFPIEAMVFLTIVFVGIQRELKRPLTREDVRSFAGQVRVYGDDIIVPTDFAPSVIAALESFGMRVNTRKSFWTGKFRESCGREFYDGHDVSVVKVRKVVIKPDGTISFPTSRRHVPEVESFVNLRNRFYAAGRWQTAKYLDTRIRQLLSGHFPNVEVLDTDPEEDLLSRSRLLGRWSFLGYQSEWTHPTLHTPLVKGWVVSTRIPRSVISDIGALQKVLSKVSDEPFADRQHLERAGRPEAVYMKLRRVNPY